MKKVLNKIIAKRKYLYMLVLGIIIGTLTVAIADTVINSNHVIYDNTTSGSSATNVKDAIDDLYDGVYNLAATAGGGLKMVVSKPKGLSSTAIGDLYRYQGEGGTSTDPNNYICFGTTNKDTCISEEGKQKYLYRIIGVTKSGQMKLIKWSSIGAYQWDTSGGVTWEQSSLCAGLNGSYFLTHEADGVKDYVPEGWEARIASVKWKMAINTNATDVASDELSSETVTTTEAKKIGLMYVSDYGYSGSSTLTYSNKNWLHSSNNGEAITESTISRRGGDIWGVSSDGSVYLSGNFLMLQKFSVRPVFYLESGEEIFDGEGTIENPYILG